MPWFSKRSDGAPSDDAPTRRGGPRLSLFVVEGADPGAELRLAHFDMEIGRGDETRARGDRLMLRDRSVSARQAKLLPGADGWTLEHLPNASNATLLNGQSIQRKLLSLADRISFGRVVLEVRVATALEAKTEIVQRQSGADTTIMMKLGGDAWGHLAVLRGPHILLGSRLPLSGERVRIGRQPDCDVLLLDPDVSRVHAELTREGERVVLRHHSRTNPTARNGVPVTGEVELAHGDQIALAESVLMRFELVAAASLEPTVPSGSLRKVMEARVDLEARLERDFVRDGSFLDVDIADSYGLKSSEPRAERVFVSFERFRGYVAERVREHDRADPQLERRRSDGVLRVRRRCGQLRARAPGRAAGVERAREPLAARLPGPDRRPHRALRRRSAERRRLQPGARRGRAPAEDGADRRRADLRGDARGAGRGARRLRAGHAARAREPGHLGPPRGEARVSALALLIGNKNYSSWSLRPWLALRQSGLAFDEERVPLNTPEFAERVRAWSPAGRVPVLRHGALAIWDSLAICEYLADAFPETRLWPADSAERAHARVGLGRDALGLPVAARPDADERAREAAARCRRRPSSRADIARIGAIWRDCRERAGARGPFLFGDFSIADAMFAPVAFRFATYGVALGALEGDYAEALRATPALRAWADAAARESETIAAGEVGT